MKVLEDLQRLRITQICILIYFVDSIRKLAIIFILPLYVDLPHTCVKLTSCSKCQLFFTSHAFEELIENMTEYNGDLSCNT